MAFLSGGPPSSNVFPATTNKNGDATLENDPSAQLPTSESLIDLITKCENQALMIKRGLKNGRDEKNASKNLRRMTKCLDAMTPCIKKQGQAAVSLAVRLQTVDDKLTAQPSTKLSEETLEFKNAYNNFLKRLPQYPGANARILPVKVKAPADSKSYVGKTAKYSTINSRTPTISKMQSKFFACPTPPKMQIASFRSCGKDYEILLDRTTASEKVIRSAPFSSPCNSRISSTFSSTRSHRKVDNGDYKVHKKSTKRPKKPLSPNWEPIVAERAHSYDNDPSKTELVLSEEQPIETPLKKSPNIATNLGSFKAERSAGFDNDPSQTEFVLSEQAPDIVIDTKNDKAIGRSSDAERIEAFTGDKSITELVVSDAPPSPSHQYPKPPSSKQINVARPALEFVLSELAPPITRSGQSSAAAPIGNAEYALDFESDKSKTELVVSELAPSTSKKRGRLASTAVFDGERATTFTDDKSKTELIVSELAPESSDNFKVYKNGGNAAMRAEKVNEYLGDHLKVIESRPAGNEKAERSESHEDNIYISKTELRLSESSEISTSINPKRATFRTESQNAIKNERKAGEASDNKIEKKFPDDENEESENGRPKSITHKIRQESLAASLDSSNYFRVLVSERRREDHIRKIRKWNRSIVLLGSVFAAVLALLVFNGLEAVYETFQVPFDNCFEANEQCSKYGQCCLEFCNKNRLKVVLSKLFNY